MNNGSNNVLVIDTVNNMVVANVGVGKTPGDFAVAITPDGKYAYVTSQGSNNVTVIDTASFTVTTVAVGVGPEGVAVTPDGKHAYVANESSANVSVIDTTTIPPSVVVTVTVGTAPRGVAVTPDGKHAYVTNNESASVSVIDTATIPPSVVATVAVGIFPNGVAVTPDGKHAYVTTDNGVLVIDTASNTVAATVAVGDFPIGVAIMPSPVGVPFLAFNAKLEIDLDRKPNEDHFELESSFTLSSTAPGINPVTDPVTLQIGSFTTTIPPGSFKKHEHEDEHEDGFFTFHGVIDGVRLEALIKRTGTLRYAFEAEARDANLAGTTNPVPVMLTIGGNSGTASVTAKISR